MSDSIPDLIERVKTLDGVLNWDEIHTIIAALESLSAPPASDPEPQPSDGPDYHAEHASWAARKPVSDDEREAPAGFHRPSPLTREGLIGTAFKAVEDHLIELRDSRISVLPWANGLVVRERDGSASSIVRMTTRMAISTAIDAILSSLSVPEPAEDEWEWGIARKRWPSSPAYFYRDREACERAIENPPVGIPNPQGPWLILRRRKAGPWVPVEKGEEQL